MIYLISDTHLNHRNIIEYENRPFKSIEEMNDTIIKRWNATVKPEDTIIHLGDICLGKESILNYLIPNLNGHKILLKGNHDCKSNHFYLNCGFDEVYNTMWLDYMGLKIFLSHYPAARPKNGENYDLHFYGHVHGNGHRGEFPTIARNGACLCVERWEYTPVAIEEVIIQCKQSGITCQEI